MFLVGGLLRPSLPDKETTTIFYEAHIMKICTKCKVEKAFSFFPKSKTHSSGCHCHCNECNRDKVRSYHKNNPEKVKARKNRYRGKLSDTHIRNTILSGIKNIPDDLIALKRAHLQLTRELKSMEQQS